MTEQDLVKKVEELMNLLDQVKMYKKALSYLPDLVIAVLSITSISLLILILIRLSFITSGLFSTISGFSSASGFSLSFQVILILFLLPSFWALIIGLLLIERKVKKIRTGEWALLLKEGAPSAIKLLTELDWESVFGDLALIKWWLAIKTVNWILLGYIILLPIFQYLFLGLSFIIPIRSIDLTGSSSLFLTTLMVLFVNRKNLKSFYYSIKSIDLLIIDLRWLYNELKGARLEA
jgi:hypothetical protein